MELNEAIDFLGKAKIKAKSVNPEALLIPAIDAVLNELKNLEDLKNKRDYYEGLYRNFTKITQEEDDEIKKKKAELSYDDYVKWLESMRDCYNIKMNELQWRKEEYVQELLSMEM